MGGGITNFLLLHGFFPDYSNSIVRGGWYIGTTVVLYLLFPILNKVIILLYNKNKYFAWILLGTLSVITLGVWCVVDLVLKRGDFIGNNHFLYFSFITQLPCFILGMILYCEKENHTFVTRKFEKLQLLIYTLATVGLFFSKWKYSFSVVPMVAGLTCYYILKMLLNKKVFGIIGKSIIKIGKKSYYIYLIHIYFAWELTSAMRKGILWICPGIAEELIYVCAVAITVIGSSILAERLQRICLLAMRLKKYKC